ncbi:hypothetical protein SKAU_G00283180 [Synaphobranchus kaupii]|uniref:Reverse transcriptase/retrotransposon-derived protein RNase H-like domain-containing protein n=1 Tax=Synaphobranchus kaupii TaxID=118154 RepID=A0A9Q1EXK9_SYNKA|nr:hypothetical protein SKAU_G00283180 [Synaphobranchus kaupii]
MAFDQLRAALTEAPVLAYPDTQRPLIVDTDASNTGVGAVLSQEDEDGERVVAYYSRALGKAEHNYCITRRIATDTVYLDSQGNSPVQGAGVIPCRQLIFKGFPHPIEEDF